MAKPPKNVMEICARFNIIYKSDKYEKNFLNIDKHRFEKYNFSIMQYTYCFNTYDKAITETMNPELLIMNKRDQMKNYHKYQEVANMPEISRFYGMIIRMYCEKGEKHNTPHIHVVYGDYEAQIALNGEIMNGDLPGGKYKVLMQWMLQNQKKLEIMWKNLLEGKTPEKIEPYYKKIEQVDVIEEETNYKSSGKGWTHIIDAIPFNNRILLLHFSNGKKKLFDVTSLEGKFYEPLMDDEVYSTLKVEGGVVTWLDGAIDCNPEYMYVMGEDYEG